MKFHHHGAIASCLLIFCTCLLGACHTGWLVDDMSLAASAGDARITEQVQAAVNNDPTLGSSEIDVATFRGDVLLTGYVLSESEIDQAVALANGVQGVTSVGYDMLLK